MRAALLKLGVLLGYITASQIASADTILLPSPDIMVDQVAVSYDASSGSFTASGYATGYSYDNAGGFYGIAAGTGSFTINGTIASATGAVSPGGLLSVGGCINEIPAGCSPGSKLLEGVLSFVQFSGIGDSQLTLVFTSLTGDLALLYGTMAYVTLNNIAFPGNFLISFNNGLVDPFSGIGDIGVVGTTAIPEPGTWAMMFIGAGLIALAKRNSFRKTN